MEEDEILNYIPLVKFIAYRMVVRLPSYIDVNDLINAGVIGLMDALEKFDSSRENQFKSYAEFRIRGAILDELRSRDWVPRSIRRKVNLLADVQVHLERELGRPAEDEEVAQYLSLELKKFQELIQQASEVFLITLDETNERAREDLVDPKGEAFLVNIYLEEVKQILANSIDELSPKERAMVSLYYYGELTMKEIGELLKVTESRISQLHTNAILHLQKKLKFERNNISGY